VARPYPVMLFIGEPQELCHAQPLGGWQK